MNFFNLISDDSLKVILSYCDEESLLSASETSKRMYKVAEGVWKQWENEGIAHPSDIPLKRWNTQYLLPYRRWRGIFPQAIQSWFDLHPRSFGEPFFVEVKADTPFATITDLRDESPYGHHWRIRAYPYVYGGKKGLAEKGVAIAIESQQLISVGLFLRDSKVDAPTSRRYGWDASLYRRPSSQILSFPSGEIWAWDSWTPEERGKRFGLCRIIDIGCPKVNCLLKVAKMADQPFIPEREEGDYVQWHGLAVKEGLPPLPRSFTNAVSPRSLTSIVQITGYHLGQQLLALFFPHRVSFWTDRKIDPIEVLFHLLQRWLFP